jgi:heme oxygenase
VAGEARTTDVLRRVRSETREAHVSVEASLDLLGVPDRRRLADVVVRLGAFWLVAEEGLHAWALRHPADAERVRWPERRRAGMFLESAAASGRAADLTTVASTISLGRPWSTGHALGTLYVLEGSTLGGQVIVRHLAGDPSGDGVPPSAWRCFDPYGPETGRMWRSFREHVTAWESAGGDPDTFVAGALRTFEALDTWCRPLREAA